MSMLIAEHHREKRTVCPKNQQRDSDNSFLEQAATLAGESPPREGGSTWGLALATSKSCKVTSWMISFFLCTSPLGKGTYSSASRSNSVA